MDTLIEDLRYGLRMLQKSPGFAAVALITLTLGIGANTALFSVVNGVLLNPLPFPKPDQLITVHESKPNFEGGSVSYPNFLDWQKDNHSFSGMAISRGYAFMLTGMGESEQVNSEFVSSDFFPLLGVKPIFGRGFLPGEDRVGAAPIAMISEGFWQRKLGSAPDVLTKTLTLDAKNYTIVGVVPASFHLSIPAFRDSDIYVPVGQWTNSLLMNRAAGLGIHGIGRLKPGVTIEQARADMESVTRNLAAAYPDVDKGITAYLVPLKAQMIGHIRPFLLMLLGSVGFVLLIACVNVANLLLARSTSRTREFAVRAALGAVRGRIVRQLLTESLLLSAAGGALGLLLATWGTKAALALLPTTLPRAEEIGIDLRVLIFTVGVSLFAGILFGLAPALKISRSNLQGTLKEGGRGSIGAHHRTQNVFVVVEMALSLVLLVGAGLMTRSLLRLWSVDPGFNPRNVLSVGLSLPPSLIESSPDAIRSAFREFDKRIRDTPGVQSVSQTWGAIPMNGDDEQLFWLEGQPKPATENEMNWAINYIVEPQYLDVMGIALQRGRFFTSQDDEHSPHVVVVDDVFAHKFFPGQDAVGKRIHLNNDTGQAEIIGVVGHVRQWGLDLDDTHSLRAQFYFPCMQMPDKFIQMAPSGSVMLVRSNGSFGGLFDAIRHTSQQMDSQQVVFGAQSMESIISDSLNQRRFAMILLGSFAFLAVLLAAIGIYGVVSYVVEQRTHEIGVRMALGAERTHILRLILGRGGLLAVLGISCGLICAVALTRLLSGLLYGVAATDPLTFALVASLLGVVALTACYIPARRAAKVDPMVALRYE